MLKSVIRRATGSSLASGISSLVVGTTAARAIGLLALPVISRIYTPEDFGQFSLLTATVTILIPIITLGYAQALPLARSERRAANVLAVAWVVGGVGVLIVAALAAILPGIAGSNQLLISLVAIAPFIVLTLAATVFLESLNVWSLRRRRYRDNAIVHIIQSAVGSSIKIGLGLIGLKPMGLLVADASGNSVSALFHLKRSGQSLGAAIRMIRRKRMLQVLVFYRRFVYFRAPAQTLAMISDKAPILLATAMFGIETSGQLGLAFLVIAVPLQLIGRSTAKVAYVELAKLYRHSRDESLRMIRLLIVRMLMLLSVPAILLAVAGPQIFSVVFGAAWVQAGIFASILSVYLVFRLVATSLQDVFSIVGRQGTFLLLSACSAMTSIGAFFIARQLGLGPNGFVGLFVGLLSIVFLMQIILTYQVVRNAIRTHAAGQT